MLEELDLIHIKGRHGGQPMLTDIRYDADGLRKPIILFVHGFKGFKDWGHFNLLADYWARKDFVVVKPNLSHNGTTPAAPQDFGDLEAFGHNTFSIELDDLGDVIDYLFSNDCAVPEREMDPDRLFLVGHSRGGGLVLLKAQEDERVKGVATLAAVSNFSNWAKRLFQPWNETGPNYIVNSRTGQQMPIYYQLVQDVEQHAQRLDIPAAVAALKVPLVLFHGTEDPAVPVQESKKLHSLQPEAQLFIKEGGDHVFGGAHPWSSHQLPPLVKDLADEIAHFFHAIG